MSGSSDHLTVRELTQDAGLNLPVVTGEVGLDRRIEGIHLSDLEDPTPWMTPGMVLITTGRVFSADTQAGLRLLDRLAGIGTVALGVGVGHYLDTVPPAMIERALRLGLPIFVAPLQVPFRAIVGYVYNSLASRDLHRLRRLLAMQSHLLDLFVEERSISDILSELAALLDMTVALYDARGNVLAASGPGLQSGLPIRMWREFIESAHEIGPLGVLESGDERFRYREIEAHGVLERVLAAASTMPTPIEFADMALTFAQRLLALDMLRATEQAMLRRRMRALLLDDLLAGAGHEADFRLRLADQEMDLDVPWRVVVCDIDDFAREANAAGVCTEAGRFEVKARLLNALESHLAARGIALLAESKADAVVALLSLPSRDTGEVRHILEVAQRSVEAAIAPLTVSLGASSSATGVGAAPAALPQALEALRVARCEAPLRGLVLHDEIERRLAFLTRDLPGIAGLHERLVKPLADYDAAHRSELVHTLDAYLRCRLSPQDAARELVVHRNTLTYRLRRIEELAGVHLDNMDDIVALFVALRGTEAQAAD
jgi:purine catabolism regulator